MGCTGSKEFSNNPLVQGGSTVFNNLKEGNEKISNKACFGAGCYWGTSHYFEHTFKGFRSIEEGFVGFMGPPDAPKNPTYKEVCSGETGHVEVYDLTYTGNDSTYEELVRFFFQFHDSTTVDRQGNDKGTQYASVIFYYDDIQMNIAMKVREELQQLIDNNVLTCFTNKKVETQLRPATEFFRAHDEHQQYLMNNPKGYCNHKMRFNEWPTTAITNQMILTDKNVSQ